MRMSICVLLLSAAVLLSFSVSSSEAQMRYGEWHVPPGKIFIKETSDGFHFASNGANLFTIVKFIRKETGLKIAIPTSRQAETLTLCVSTESIAGILKSALQTNYILAFDGNDGIKSISVLEAGSHENGHLPMINQFNGQVVVKENVASVFYVPPTDDIEQYILSRHLVLDQLNESHPETHFNAQISFNAVLSKKQLLDALEGDDLIIVDLNTINGEFTGGNRIPEGMTLREAVDSADDAEMEFLDVHCTEEIASESAPISEQCKEMYESHGNGGTKFYGAMVRAKPQKLTAIRDNSEYTRLVDPLWSGKVHDELSREYKVNNIPVPLIPETK